MRRGWVRPLRLSGPPVRFVSTFAQLYGREREEDGPAPTILSSSASHNRHLTSSPTSGEPTTVTELFRRHDDQLYVDPTRNDAALARDTLRAVRTLLHDPRVDNPAYDNGREVAHVWRKALSVVAATPLFADTSPSPSALSAESLEAAQECVAVLWLTRHYEAVLSVAERALMALCAQDPAPSSASSSTRVVTAQLHDRLASTQVYCSVATLLTACVMASGELGTPLSQAVADVTEVVLQDAKSHAHRASKGDKAHVAHACAGLVWALDWAWHFHPDDVPRRWTGAVLRTHALPWMTHTFEKSVTVESATAPQSPPSHLVKAATTLSESSRDKHHACENGEALKRLYLSAATRARDTPALFFFDLPVRVGSAVLSTSTAPPATQAAVVHALGHALPPEVLEAYALTQPMTPSMHSPSKAEVAVSPLSDTTRAPVFTPFEAAVGVLARMCGSGPYHALRRLARTGGRAHLLASVQQRYGDVLSADSGVTWLRSLTTTEQIMQRGDALWQKTLPNTLRLLADAEKPAQFFSLLRECRPSDAEKGVVAASLASVMRQTGRWWHALEVVDLIAEADVPHSESDDAFLCDAVLDTLAALRHAQRWQESLAIVAALAPLVAAPSPAREAFTSVVWSTVVEMPVGAPWQTAVSLVAPILPPPASATHSLSVTHGAATQPLPRLPRGDKARQRLLFLLSNHGRWQTLASALPLAASPPRAEADNAQLLEVWRHVLRALQRDHTLSDVAAARELLKTLPLDSLLPNPELLRHTFRVCELLGSLDVFAALLPCAQHTSQSDATSARAGSSLCGEYRDLIAFMGVSEIHSSVASSSTRRSPAEKGGEREVVVTDRFVARQFLSHYCAGGFRVRYEWPSRTGRDRAMAQLSKQEVAAQLARDLRCSADQIRVKSAGRDCAWLLPPRPDPFAKSHLSLSNPRAVVGFKPPGATLAKVAVAALAAAARDEVCTALYGMPPGWSGLFVLRPSLLTHVGLAVHLAFTVKVLPHSPSTAVPVMATSWWRTYKCQVRDGVIAGLAKGVVVDGTLCVSGSVESVDEAIRQWRASLNADGWGIVEAEGGVSGESVHVSGVTVSGGDPTDACSATTTLLPYWLQPTVGPDDAEAFDEIAFLSGSDASLPSP